MSLTRAHTRTTRFEDERTNHEATSTLTKKLHDYFIYYLQALNYTSVPVVAHWYIPPNSFPWPWQEEREKEVKQKYDTKIKSLTTTTSYVDMQKVIRQQGFFEDEWIEKLDQQYIKN